MSLLNRHDEEERSPVLDGLGLALGAGVFALLVMGWFSAGGAFLCAFLPGPC